MYYSIEAIQCHCVALYRQSICMYNTGAYMHRGIIVPYDISTFARRTSDSGLVLRVALHIGPDGPLFHLDYRGIPHCPLVHRGYRYHGVQIPYGADYHGKSETQCMSCDSGLLRMHENNAGSNYGHSTKSPGSANENPRNPHSR